MSTPAPLENARELFARGLAPVPVPYRKKGPVIKGWQKLRLSPAELPSFFPSGPMNVGTLLGDAAGWIVDVDLDHVLAVQKADAFLPTTGMVWGRDSKPRSHRLYRLTSALATRKWQSKQFGMIVELRSSGCQTLAPGSTHPSGESVRWDEDGEPALIDPTTLMLALDSLAVAVMHELGECPDTPGVPPTLRVAPIPVVSSAYGREALRREAATVAGAAKGSRNDALNAAAFSVGTLIGGGELDRPTAEAELLAASRSCGLPDSESQRTIASGLTAGAQKPRQPPVRAGKLERALGAKVVSVASASPKSEVVLAYTPFPTHVLPKPIARYVCEGAKAIGCDESYLALPLLSALAAAIGNTHRIELKHGWAEPAIVWTAIVGESGTAKSPAMEAALREPRRRQHQAMKRHADELMQYADAIALYERDLLHWKKSGGDAPVPSKPEAPLAERFWTDDTTTEALAVLLQQNPRGLLMVRDELSGWFNFDRYSGGKGGGDAAKWLEMFGGRPMMVDRKSGGSLYVPRAAVSIAGGIQPATLQRALGQEHRDNGLAARLLLACPPRKPKRWTDADLDRQTEDVVAMVFGRLFDLTPESDDGDEEPRLLKLADDGKLVWVDFYNEHASVQVDLAGDEAAAWAKLEGYAARLALVIHLTRWAAGDGALRDVLEVDGASIAAGVALARWFGRESQRVYAILGESDDARDSRRLVEWIDQQGGTVSIRDLTRGPRAYRNDLELATQALDGLVKAGIGAWDFDDHSGQRGRPVSRFRLLSRQASAGDGDTNAKSHSTEGISVAVASVADPQGTDYRWGEL